MTRHTSLRVSSIAPHLSARALDDFGLQQAMELARRLVREAVEQRLLSCTDATVLESIPGIVSDPPLTRDDAGWIRAYLLALCMEWEFRMGKVPEGSDLLDVVPRPSDWRVQAMPVGISWEQGREELADEWRRAIEYDSEEHPTVPVWTRREPPGWLEQELWKHEWERSL